ncbi:lysin B [Mycobacterium phage Anubis]|uniref:Lysin B n=1 Tax=Mycobacterium phage Anubis TaxID=1354511 RepID=A0A097BYL0_9CAUD|nr:lysin B [Mycobacterium phage Anubis]AIS74089.1 lysin B [Mycobacterium phage Anubis]QAY10620.1 lysin B [Mycobacterium phage GingkoMaracino]
MPLRVGSNDANTGGLVSRWQKTMLARFQAYAKAYDGGPLRVDGYFGYDDADVQREYERRTHQTVDGEVSDADLRALGLEAAKRWLFTVHGTGMPDPLGPGLPADTARAVLDKYTWQPIGNYPAAVFPMWPSIQAGRTELRNQIAAKAGEVNLAGYSQGAVVVGQVLKHDIMDPKGSLHHRLGDVRKVVMWGNPMRQKGIAHDDRWIHKVAGPDTYGILEDRLEGLDKAPFEVRDYAHEDDMFASVRDDDIHEYQIAIAKIVMTATDFWQGPNSLVAQLTELGQRPLPEGIALANSILDALKFATNTAHGYNIGPAIEFLRS